MPVVWSITPAMSPFLKERAPRCCVITTFIDEQLEVQSEITSMRGASLTFAQRIVNSDGTLLSQADVLIACIDPHQMKPIALPKSIVAEFKQ